MMKPTAEWLKSFKEIREKLTCPAPINNYFTMPEIAGKKLDLLDFGIVSIPTGVILVRDPLCYLDCEEEPYFTEVPPGEFHAVACVVSEDDSDCSRYAAVRVQFTKKEAVTFEEALIGNENLSELEDDEYYGFNVDAGLACICDIAVRDAFCEFYDDWSESNPGKNIYDDYFAAIFAKSYAENPKHQREGGDWINWIVPGTNYHLPIFQTGFGDGTYPVYFGYDADGKICQLVIQFIDIDLAYGDED
ncbi:hypothetical protein A3207_07785 [Candidatus Methanomassiliicoccus intestinalis]|uniref:DUF4241 domain-containing protein n=2 Tax=Candidatus Methanomassiliicoccus intestinalis TaxID=1406512 RepID=A0A8J8PDT9_9ARCH|nr:MAG: hypothetical protein A3207_07785 [Candidatus Methanomassiliicoccus intestinalis]